MTTATQTLTEFLLARIAEDRAKIDGDWTEGYGLHIISADMYDRMVAECEAKRALVQTFDGHLDGGDGYAVAANIALEAMALPYGDHPDYRDQWRP